MTWVKQFLCLCLLVQRSAELVDPIKFVSVIIAQVGPRSVPAL